MTTIAAQKKTTKRFTIAESALSKDNLFFIIDERFKRNFCETWSKQNAIMIANGLNRFFYAEQ